MRRTRRGRRPPVKTATRDGPQQQRNRPGRARFLDAARALDSAMPGRQIWRRAPPRAPKRRQRRRALPLCTWRARLHETVQRAPLAGARRKPGSEHTFVCATDVNRPSVSVCNGRSAARPALRDVAQVIDKVCVEGLCCPAPACKPCRSPPLHPARRGRGAPKTNQPKKAHSPLTNPLHEPCSSPAWTPVATA